MDNSIDQSIPSLVKSKPEKIFLCISLVVGFLFLFLVPPFQVPDEPAHFINAYAVSQGNFFADVDPKTNQIGIELPNSIVGFLPINTFDPTYKYSYDQMISYSVGKYDKSITIFFPESGRMLNPVAYLISGFGVFVGKLFGFNESSPYNLFIFARLFNLMFYIFVVYQAIRMTPYFKRTMLLLALMPMTLTQAASISYDAIIIPIVFLFFAYVLKIYLMKAENKISLKEIVILGIITFFMAGIKMVYLPLLITCITISFRKFGSLRRYLLSVSAIVVIILVVILIPSLMNQKANMVSINPFLESETLQQEYLLSHLDQIPNIIVNTFAVKGELLTQSFFGLLGWLQVPFPLPIYTAFFIILIITVLVDVSEASGIDWKFRMLSVLAVLISFFGMAYTMYVEFTSHAIVGLDRVEGLQGRYFIPLALFFFMAFSNNLLARLPHKISLTINSLSTQIVYYSTALTSAFTIFLLYSRYWAN